ncbi:hypothetical protein H6P81_018340 [Aristolochia fimbriata]|uniref:Aminotransferase-like plant mobile domain-containing protein n=1 Tax=Aristolochia fimbriata TaxID=158543 RepID=A0AAV7E3Z2_ARIFI|nr:hypothetical protein H6P81_018340 [Aristolochia fimbriata]
MAWTSSPTGLNGMDLVTHFTNSTLASLARGDRVFFLPCPGSSEDEAVAAGPETLALQSAFLVVNRPPRTLQDRFMDGGVVPTFQAPDTTLDTSIPFLYEWTTLLLGRCSRILRDAGVYYGLWASIFQYNCDVSVVRAFIDGWSTETNTLVTCQGELSITLLDMDWIFGLPIFGHFYDEVSPTVADFTNVRSSALPYSCRCLFLAYHNLCRSSEFNVLSTTAWVEFWFRTEDDAVPVHDPWTAWYARYGKGAATPRERTNTKREVFDFLHVTPGKEDEVHLAALLSIWLSRYVFHSTADDLRPMVFKVGSYMAIGVSFALAGPALACLYKDLGQAVVGWPLIAQWPCIPGWQSTFTLMGRILKEPVVQARNLFRRLPVLVWNRYALGGNSVSFLVDDSTLKKQLSKATYESLLSVRCCFLTVHRSIRYFIEPYPTRFVRQFGYCQDLPGDLGVKATNRLEPAPTVSAAENSEEEEDYDSDRSHSRRRHRSKGKKPVGVSLANKKRAPLAALNDTSVKKKPRKEAPPVSFPPSPPTFLPPIPEIEPHLEPQTSCPPKTNPPIETVQILSSPEAPEAPQEEVSSPGAIAQTDLSVVAALEGTKVVEELADVTPALTQPEALPIQEVAPSVVQEPAEEEVVVEILQERAPTVEEEEAVEVLQERAPTVEEEAPTTVVHEETLAPAFQEEVPAVETLVPVVEIQDTTTPLTLSTPSAWTLTPSQQLLSHVEGLMLQVWKDRLEDGEITLSEVDEELSEAKADEEDAREREEDARESLELAREQTSIGWD